MRGRLQCYMWGWMDGWDGMVIIRHRYSNNTSKLCRTFSALSALVTTIVSNARTLGSDCARILWKCSSSSCSHPQLFNAISRLNVIVIVFIFVHICPRSVQCPHFFWQTSYPWLQQKIYNILHALFYSKHCQRHNRPPGWVQLTRVT